MTCKISQAIASVTGDSAECPGGTAEAQGAESDDGDEDPAVPNPSPQPTGATQRQPSPKPGPSPLPTYPGLPYGLVPDSDLVRTMQLTERGRQTLQWLADNNVQVYIDDDAGGAFWNGRYITMGHGPGEALTLIHEANHARYSMEGRDADAGKLSRQDYIDAGIAEEVDGVIQEIEAVQEFRAAGYNGPPPTGEAEYNNAYQNAKASGSNDATARQAGRDAIRQAFENGAFVGVGSGKTYSDSLGASWDSQHSCYFLFIRWKC